MVGNGLILGFTPRIYSVTSDQARASFKGESLDAVENFQGHVLEHGRHNVLLERRQMLRHLPVNLVVLAPQL